MASQNEHMAIVPIWQGKTTIRGVLTCVSRRHAAPLKHSQGIPQKEVFCNANNPHNFEMNDKYKNPLIAGIVFASVCGIVLYWAMTKALFFDGYFANGAFQLFNPLRRLADGQIPGRDFQMFHGLGNTLMHYPIFSIFGSNLYSSEVARLFLSPFLYVAVVFTFALLAGRSFALAFICTAVMLFSAPFLFERLYSPSNSILGARSACSMLACASLLIHEQRVRYVWFAVFAGLAIASSTEQGIAVLVAAASVGGLQLLLRRSFAILGAALVAMAIAVTIFAASTNGDLIPYLKYNYQSVMQDQIWYFGAPPNPYGMLGVKQIVKDSRFWAGSALSAASVSVVLYQWFRQGLTDRVIAALFCIAYGAVTLGSLTGYVVYGSMEPFVRACVFGAMICFLPEKLQSAKATVLSGAALVGLVIFMYYPVKGNRTDHLVSGVTLSDRWAKHLAEVKKLIPGREKLWADYAGLVEAEIGGFQPVSDYIIHAVGPDLRAEYVQRFRSDAPEWVRTNNVCAWNWGTWLLNENWPFYKEVLMNYEVSYADTLGSLFKRSTATVAEIAQNVPVDESGCVTVMGRKDELLEMTVEYALQPANRPGLNKLPRYLLEPRYQTGSSLLGWPVPISVPPNGYPNKWSFPIRVQKGSEFKLCPVVDPEIGNASFSLYKVTISALPVPQKTLDYLRCEGKDRAYHSH